VLRALEAGASVIGVNARDLTTLEVDRHTIEQVIDVIPEDVGAVAESSRGRRVPDRGSARGLGGHQLSGQPRLVLIAFALRLLRRSCRWSMRVALLPLGRL